MRDKTNARILRDFDRAHSRVASLDTVVNRLQQMRRSRVPLLAWWGRVRSRRVIRLAIDARDDLIVCRRAARRRGLLNHRA